jgi:Reverse transcriptase (RNA-dependent DNA polymerase)
MTIMIILMVMAGWYGSLTDVHGAFLKGHFGVGEQLHMHVPQGFEEYYGSDVVLLLLKTIYGFVQSAYVWWRIVLAAFGSMGYERSKVDSCLFYKWTEQHGLQVWMTWIDNCFSCGTNEAVNEAKQQLHDYFKGECDDGGELQEYVGCKIEYNRDQGWIQLTQPVLVQSFKDEHDLPDAETPITPAIPGKILTESETILSKAKHTYFHSGVGKLLHLMKWSRPEIMNAVQDLTRFATKVGEPHIKAMHRVMKYCVDTPKRGLLLKPDAKWNGDPAFEFTIGGRADSDFSKDPSTRSITGYNAFLNGASFSHKSHLQTTTTLSVTEAETVAAVECVQDMLFGMHLLESMGLKVKKPMVLEIDNKGAKDLAHNWSIGGRTRHITTKINFLRELKEQGILIIRWIPTAANTSDLFTKNLNGPDFEWQTADYIGFDEYMKHQKQEKQVDAQGENGRNCD